MSRKLWLAAIVLAVLFGSHPTPVPTAVADRHGPRSINRVSEQATRSESDHQLADPACFASLGVTTAFSSTDASAVQQAIDTAAIDDVVKVAGYCAGVSSRDGVTQTVFISKSLTIRGGYTNTNWIDFDPVGQPTTLDAQAGGRVLYLTADIHSTIEGLRITGGNAQVSAGGSDGNEGGGVYVITATVILSGSEVFGNTAGQGAQAADSDNNSGNGGSGGGVYNNGVLTITHTALHDNRAGHGGSTYSGSTGAGGSGGSIYNNQSLSVLNSMVTNNVAGNGGLSALFHKYGPGGDGGGIYNNGWLFVGDSSLNSNRSGAGARSGYGGGIFNHNILTVTNSTLTDNATSDGSPGYHFVGGAGGAGGGLYNDGTLNVIESTVNGNHTGAGGGISGGAGGQGGGIFSRGTLTVIKSTLHGNQTGDGGGGLGSIGGDGGGVAVVQGSAQLSHNTVTSNTASYRGGGFYFSAGSVIMTNTLMSDNAAAVTGSGLAAAQTSVTIKHATVVSNTGGDGSGIFIGDNSTADLINLIVAQHAVGITASIASTTHVTSVLWFNNALGNVGGPGPISVTAAFTGFPAFVDPPAGDFRLTVASAAINRGVNAHVPIDLDGAGRDAAPDLGAYEYQWSWRFYLPTIRHE